MAETIEQPPRMFSMPLDADPAIAVRQCWQLGELYHPGPMSAYEAWWRQVAPPFLVKGCEC